MKLWSMFTNERDETLGVFVTLLTKHNQVIITAFPDLLSFRVPFVVDMKRFLCVIANEALEFKSFKRLKPHRLPFRVLVFVCLGHSGLQT
jgi:hypothetical protein